MKKTIILILISYLFMLGLSSCVNHLKPRPADSYIINMDGYDIKYRYRNNKSKHDRWKWVIDRWIWIPY